MAPGAPACAPPSGAPTSLGTRRSHFASERHARVAVATPLPCTSCSSPATDGRWVPPRSACIQALGITTMCGRGTCQLGRYGPTPALVKHTEARVSRASRGMHAGEYQWLGTGLKQCICKAEGDIGEQGMARYACRRVGVCWLSKALNPCSCKAHNETLGEQGRARRAKGEAPTAA